jgi:hypothetical protein
LVTSFRWCCSKIVGAKKVADIVACRIQSIIMYKKHFLIYIYGYDYHNKSIEQAKERQRCRWCNKYFFEVSTAALFERITIL